MNDPRAWAGYVLVGLFLALVVAALALAVGVGTLIGHALAVASGWPS